MSKRKVLFIMHLPPPVHGPAIVGKFIYDSKLINDTFDIDYINLQTATSLRNVGKGGFSKIFIFLKLYQRVLAALWRNKYEYCYLTINAHSAAFFKEMVIVFFLKLFGVKPIYYYHMKGVSLHHHKRLNHLLYSYQFRNSRTILLSPYIYYDIKKYVPEDEVFYCIEGIPDTNTKTIDQLLAIRKANPVPKMLFLSNLMKAKGVYVLLDACKILKDKGLQFEMIYIGGELDVTRADLEAYVTKHGLQELVKYVGPKYGDDKIAYFEQVDMFIHPTLNDVLPLTIMEAVQFGLPVVSSKEGAIPEIITDEVNGLIVPMGEPDVLAEKNRLFVDKSREKNRNEYYCPQAIRREIYDEKL